MKYIYLLSLFAMLSCHAQTAEGSNTINQDESRYLEDSVPKKIEKTSEVDKYYQEHNISAESSLSIGTVSKGSLKNGRLIPFFGANFKYFDSLSYLNGRAFVNDKLKTTILKTYSNLEKEIPDRQFCIMECSNENGGEIYPHRTHQNGLSVDFMTPLIKDGKAYYKLDTLGGTHYLLEFDNNGKYSEDSSISIDFETMAKHIWFLDQMVEENGMKISKIILKTELKDDLFATTFGKKLKNSSIYFTQNLSPLINSLHDDHYHIDFELK